MKYLNLVLTKYWQKITKFWAENSSPLEINSKLDSKENKENEENDDLDNGIYVLFELKNNGDQNIKITNLQGNEIAGQSLAVFLLLSETGNLYNEVMQEIIQLNIEEPENKPYFKEILKYKQILDSKVEKPPVTMRPSDVFNIRR